jgi:hypothetical protein
MALIHIDVTQNDINNGTPGLCASCPIAIAASRAMESGVRVGLVRIFLDDFTCAAPYLSAGRMPPEALRFIDAFDHHQPVAPFSFDVEMEVGV